MSNATTPAVWFPAIRAGTGADVFTTRLAEGLRSRGVRAEISWLPHRAEYLPFNVIAPKAPDWVNITHVNTWLHRRFVPTHMPVVATMHHCVHDPAFSKYKNRKQEIYHRLWIKPIEAWILSRADIVTAVSDYTAGRTLDTFDIEDIKVIYNGVDTKVFMPAERRNLHNPFRLLYIGSWSTRKGVDLLAPIMDRLGEAFQLSYTSDTAMGNARMKLPPNCHSIGKPNLAGLIEQYQNSDALLFPTRLEGFGQVAAEANACGLPVITTNGSAMTEVVTDGVTGLLCEQDDPEDFANAARLLRRQEGDWLRMSINARKSASSKFDIDEMLEKYILLYKTLL